MQNSPEIYRPVWFFSSSGFGAAHKNEIRLRDIRTVDRISQIWRVKPGGRPIHSIRLSWPVGEFFFFSTLFFIKIYSPSIVPWHSNRRNAQQPKKRGKKNHQNASSDYGRHSPKKKEHKKVIFIRLTFGFLFAITAAAQEQFNAGLWLLFRTLRFQWNQIRMNMLLLHAIIIESVKLESLDDLVESWTARLETIVKIKLFAL